MSASTGKISDRELGNGPPPLSDEMYPDGLPGLSASDVLSAVVEEAVSRGVICIIENPRNSIY